MIKKFSIPLTVLFSMMMLASSAHAGLTVAKKSTKTKGATTITWDSSFLYTGYALGSTIQLHVGWTVDAGAAMFDSIELKEKNPFTPKSRNDPAIGELVESSVGKVTMGRSVTRKDSGIGEIVEESWWTLNDDSDDGDNSGEVQVTFKFTGLHLDRRRNVDIGNAHFKLYLNIDKDGDGILESVAGYGVNVHVEDPLP